MSQTKKVYLLVGPRGAGKSHYSGELRKSQPELSIISRDAVKERIFGSVHTDPYSGCDYYTQHVIARILRRRLAKLEDTKIIFDMWNGSGSERRELIKDLRSFGATHITALYFITPVEKVEEWFWLKPGVAKISEMRTRKGEGLTFYSEGMPRRDWEIYHQMADGLDMDGFDKVIRVNPLESLITLE